jgi:hypothetical protein
MIFHHRSLRASRRFPGICHQELSATALELSMATANHSLGDTQGSGIK